MKAARLAVHAACWTLLHLYLASLQVQASGVFELHIKYFRNDQGLNADGNCCNGYRSQDRCSSPCHTFFRVCLTHYQQAIATKPESGCTFGEYTSKVVAHNSVNFSVPPSDLPALDSPIAFPIKNVTWPANEK
ncbi:hypothetical protein ACOMHN_025977 [Nucella lapillus]